MTSSADMGWQKRGNGFRYDSLSGHNTLMGALSGNILAVQVMCSSCVGCQRNNGACGKPTCKKNHWGSAKSMEAASSVLLLRSDILVEAGIKVGTLIGDEDSSTAAAILKEFNGEVARASDIMHTQKILSKSLYKFMPEFKVLTTQVIEYFVATLGTIVKKNKGQVAELETSLRNVPDHVFGNHNGCGTWCTGKENPELYRSKHITCNLGTVGSPLYDRLVYIFERLACHADRLAPCGSTQQNESVNNIVRSKANKANHYGGSDSLTYRVHAAVCQKNIGVTYVSNVLEELGESPLSGNYKACLQDKRQHEAEERKKPEYKTKRKLNYKTRQQRTRLTENREGESYRPGLGFDNPEAPCMIKAPSIKKVWKQKPLSTLPVVNHSEPTYVFFDTETSGRSYEFSEILQISATTELESFNTYITPTKRIPSIVSGVNGLTFTYGKLRVNNVVVNSIKLELALERFVKFLSEIENCVLVAHNAHFDARFFVNNLKKFPTLLEHAQNVVLGFVDTLRMFRILYPKKDNPKLDNYKLISIVKFMLDENYIFEEHNAVGDIQALKDVVKKIDKPILKYLEFSFTFKSFINWLENGKKGEELNMLQGTGVKLKSLRNMVDEEFTLLALRQLCNEKDVNTIYSTLLSFKIEEQAIRSIYQLITGK